MLKLATAFLVTTALASPALALDIRAASRIDSVIVYPQGAEVTRIAEAGLEPGDHKLIFEGLPGELQPETIRVEGVSEGRVDIGSVDSRLVSLSAAEMDAERRRIEAEIERLQDERTGLDQTIGDAEFQKGLMRQLATGALTDQPSQGQTRILGAGELGGVLDLVGAKLAVLAKTILEAKTRQRAIDKEVAELTGKLDEIAPRQAARMTVTVHLSAPVETSGTFKISYRVASAGWTPIYDARLVSPTKDKPGAVELVRRAEVVQSTAESWDNVALTLSTARPLGATAAPDLEPMALESFEEGRARNYSRSDTTRAAEAQMDKDLGAAGTPRGVAQKEAEIAVAGFQALYAIAGSSSIDNTGTAKKLRIATDRLSVKLSARAVPKLDPVAYLTAGFTLGGDTPLLPGAVMLYRDGVYMGEGQLPLLSPGEEHRLGFGADDLIKVKRVEVKRMSGEEGLISTSQVESRAYDITVKNLHDFTMPVMVLDQMPYSIMEGVTVETLAGMTPASDVNAERKRGVLAWRLNLEPKQDAVVKHGYKIAWPAEMKIGLN